VVVPDPIDDGPGRGVDNTRVREVDVGVVRLESKHVLVDSTVIEPVFSCSLRSHPSQPFLYYLQP
jgi:hypothetical protein